MGGIPSDPLAGGACSLGIEIGDDRNLQPPGRRHLRQEHRAELPGADQPDAHRPVRFCALL
jgi:hypothetical protein